MGSHLGRVKDASPRWLKVVANGSTRAWGLATSHFRPGPSFLVVGTKRGGTTSLWNNMLLHPQVSGLFPEARGKKSTDYFFVDGSRSPRWYRSHFPTGPAKGGPVQGVGGAISGEASPYYMYGPNCPRMIAEEFPDVRIIVLLRDPVERAYSHYQERRKQGAEALSFEAALDAEDRRLAHDEDRWRSDRSYYSRDHDFFSYRSRGIYLPQLLRIYREFPVHNVHVDLAENFYSDYQTAFDAVTDFLGLDRHALGLAQHHNRIERADMLPETRSALTRFYSPHNEALEQYLERRLPWARI